jgi:isopenicillin N synthase-like dioxygenase
MEKVGIELIKGLDIYLGAKGKLKSLVISKSGKPIGNHMMRSINYPAVPKNELKAIELEPGKYSRGGVHADLNLITLLPQATMEGLELKRRDGTWMPLYAQEGALIVNAGDMLQLMTEGSPNAIPSTLHRVVGNDENMEKTRITNVWFGTPNFMKPLVNLQTGKPVTAYDKPMTEAGMYVYERLKGHGALKDVSYEDWKKGSLDYIKR